MEHRKWSKEMEISLTKKGRRSFDKLKNRDVPLII